MPNRNEELKKILKYENRSNNNAVLLHALQEITEI